MSRFSNPRVYLPSAVIGGVSAVSAGAWFLFDNWLVALIIALSLLLTVLVLLVVRMLIGREREERLGRGLEDDRQIEFARSSESQTSTRRGLQGTFKEAVSEMRRQLDAGVSELPWFLLIGPYGAGKTTLLEASGLDVPAQYARARMTGPTPSLDFFLSNEAVVLDTPGRYFDGAESDSEEWETLLGLLRNTRPDCALDGVIFALPASLLLSGAENELRQTAQQLRRRLNEIEDKLGVVAPVYLVVTGSDQIEGFVELAQRLPESHVRSALGWTNDHRDVVEESEVAQAFNKMSERFDRLLPELLLGEPDRSRQTSLFLFPQELADLGGMISRFVAEAFKPSVYRYEKPFLRGVYLVSAKPQGSTSSPTLRRLGHDWARTSHAEAPSGLFMRDLFLEIMVGDEGVAVPGSRLGPLGRRLVLGLGGVACAVALAVWGYSFASNYQGTERLATLAKLLQSTDPPLEDLDAMRIAIEEEDAATAGFANSVGFQRLDGSVERAKAMFTHAFSTHYDRPTKKRLHEAVRRRDDHSVRAAVVLAGDLGFLASENPAEEPVPDLASFVSLRAKDPEKYTAAYRAYASWLREPDRLELLREEQGLFEGVVDRILDVHRLEELTRSPSGSYPAATYPSGLPHVGAGESSTSPHSIPGLYTKAGFEGLVSNLLGAYERSGTAAPGKLMRFQRTYAERFDRSWRKHLLDAPTSGQPDPDVKRSPYLALISQIDDNTRVKLEREGAVPDWIETLRETRKLVGFDTETPAPWPQYLAALENVQTAVEDARALDTQALALVRDVATDQPNAFTDALAIARKIVPRGRDSAATAKLRRLLELPILNGFSAVAGTAVQALDESWQRRIVEPFGANCGEGCLARLYGPGGELESFRKDELDPFYSDSGARPLLEDRALPLGPQLLSWMENAGGMKTGSGFSGRPVSVRVRAIPARVTGEPGLLAKRVDLRLSCPDGPQVFTYRSGDHDHTFTWSSSCDQLTLRVVLASIGGASERQAERVWNGSFAFPDFLKQGVPSGSNRLGWNLTDGDATVLIRYEVLTGRDLRDMAHQAPPSSLGS